MVRVMNKKILIIGNTSNLAKVLIKQLNIFDIYTAGRNGADYYFDAEKEILDEKFLNKKFDVIINTMASFGSNYTEDYYKTEKINVLGCLKICELAKETECKHLIQISSIFQKYKEKDPYYNIYSISKRHADELIKLYCAQEKIPYTILMPSQIYDFQGNCKKHQSFLYSIIRQVKNNQNITIYGSNDAKRNYIYIGDLAEIIEKVIAINVFGEYCCCALSDTKISELVSAAKYFSKSNSSITFDKTKNDIMDLPDVYTNDLYKIINYKPKMPIEKGIEQILKEI